MNELLFLCYPGCSTCRKAQQWLDDHQILYTLRDIKRQNPTAEELAGWQQMSGGELKRFFNTSGLIYRQHNLKDRLPTMTEAEQLDLLATDGMLVKRPLLIGPDFALTGFREAQWAEVIAANGGKTN